MTSISLQNFAMLQNNIHFALKLTPAAIYRADDLILGKK